MVLSIREAAREAGVSKSTILRAIQRGRLSAARDDDGNYEIQPAEVFRVYPPRTAADTAASGQGTPASDTAVMQERCAGLDAQLSMLRERLDEMKEERDRWRGQAERLALTQAQPITRRGLFGWLRSA